MVTDKALLAALGPAQQEFARLVGLVQRDQWSAATPCAGWDVQDLVQHATGTGMAYVAMLDGASSEEAFSVTLDHRVDDMDPSVTNTAVEEAFARPGVLDQIYHYFTRDLPGRVILSFRVVDVPVHAWDLGQALGHVDQTGDGVLQTAWDALQPLLPVLSGSPLFARPTGSIELDVPIKQRLLRASGRVA